MAGELTDVGENLALDYLNGRAPTAPVTPLKVWLVTVMGTDSTAGTRTGPSKTIAPAAASAGAVNGTVVSWTGGEITGAPTIVGYEIEDSSGSPRVLWRVPLAASKVVNVGDPVDLTVNLSMS